MTFIYARGRNTSDRRRWDVWHIMYANGGPALCGAHPYLADGQKSETPKAGELCVRCAEVAQEASVVVEAWRLEHDE